MAESKINANLSKLIQQKIDNARGELKEASELARDAGSASFQLRSALSQAVAQIGEAEAELRVLENPIRTDPEILKRAELLIKRMPISSIEQSIGGSRRNE